MRDGGVKFGSRARGSRGRGTDFHFDESHPVYYTRNELEGIMVMYFRRDVSEMEFEILYFTISIERKAN